MRQCWSILAVFVLVFLGACRDEEQDRTLQFEKGIYSGEPMPIIDEDTRENLQHRTRHQGF